jgi:hypothetical protein
VNRQLSALKFTPFYVELVVVAKADDHWSARTRLGPDDPNILVVWKRPPAAAKNGGYLRCI